jgi:methyltransferase OMS1
VWKDAPIPELEPLHVRLARIKVPRKPPHRRGYPAPWIASAFVFSFALSWTYASYQRTVSRPPPDPAEAADIDVTAVYDEGARGFDDASDGEEWLTRVRGLRKRMARMAEGDVLESAVGTGRNLAWYDAKKVRSLTMVDRSKEMLEICRRKWERESDKKKSAIKTSFLVGDLSAEGMDAELHPPNDNEQPDPLKKFDMVVESNGLCSTEDPVKLLKSLGRMVKPNGKIVLVEHGLSHYDWLNKLLRATTLDHAKKHGCWWDRDIQNIVYDSGLEIENLQRYTWGTIWWLELKPKKEDLLEKLRQEAVAAQAAKSSLEPISNSSTLVRSWWPW